MIKPIIVFFAFISVTGCSDYDPVSLPDAQITPGYWNIAVYNNKFYSVCPIYVQLDDEVEVALNNKASSSHLFRVGPGEHRLMFSTEGAGQFGCLCLFTNSFAIFHKYGFTVAKYLQAFAQNIFISESTITCTGTQENLDWVMLTVSLE